MEVLNRLIFFQRVYLGMSLGCYAVAQFGDVEGKATSEYLEASLPPKYECITFSEGLVLAEKILDGSLKIPTKLTLLYCLGDTVEGRTARMNLDRSAADHSKVSSIMWSFGKNEIQGEYLRDSAAVLLVNKNIQEAIEHKAVEAAAKA